MRTTLKSTVSSGYCSNDHWDSLVTQLDQIYSWEAPYTALLYTLLHVRARSKVGFRGAKGAIGHSAPSVPCGSASRPPAVWPARAGWEAGPAPSLRLLAALKMKRRPQSSLRRRRPSPAAALVDPTALRVASAAKSRVFVLGLDGGDDWRGLRGLGRVGRAVSDCERSVEGAVDSAVRAQRRARGGLARRSVL